MTRAMTFFVDVTWDEYRRLAGEYEIDGGAAAEEVIEIQKERNAGWRKRYPIMCSGRETG